MVTAVGRAAVTDGAGAADRIRRVVVDYALRKGGSVMANGADTAIQGANRRTVGAGLTEIVSGAGVDMTECTLIAVDTDNHIDIGYRIMTGGGTATGLCGSIPAKGGGDMAAVG